MIYMVFEEKSLKNLFLKVFFFFLPFAKEMTVFNQLLCPVKQTS